MATEEREMTDAEVKSALDFIDANFVKSEKFQKDLAEMREHYIIDMRSLVLGWCVHRGHSLARSKQIGDAYVAKEEVTC